MNLNDVANLDLGGKKMEAKLSARPSKVLLLLCPETKSITSGLLGFFSYRESITRPKACRSVRLSDGSWTSLFMISSWNQEGGHADQFERKRENNSSPQNKKARGL